MRRSFAGVGTGVGPSVRLIGHPPSADVGEMTLNQFAEQAHQGLLLRPRQLRPNLRGPRPHDGRRRRRGGTGQSRVLDMRFLLVKRDDPDTIAPTGATLPRRSGAATPHSDSLLL